MAAWSQRHELFCLIFYAGLLIITLATIAATFVSHGLFPLDPDNLAWSNAWLLSYMINYYGACLCFCGVIVGTEEAWWTALLWVISCCTIGAPACCFYIFLWVTKEGGTLRLERGSLSLNVLAAASEKARVASIHTNDPRKVYVEQDTTSIA